MLTLRIPTLADMTFRQAMLADPATMAYSAPWSAPDGCIAFPESEWATWLDKWTNHAPERFYALLVTTDGVCVGEVEWHEYGKRLGVIIAAEHRCKGYGAAGLKLLAEQAFRFAEISELCEMLPMDREASIATYLRAGFAAAGLRDGDLMLRLTRERWESQRRETWLRQVTDAMCAYDEGASLRIHHFLKMHAFARQIGLHERLDENTQFVLEVAALTHDIGIKHCIEQTGACPGNLQEQLGPPEAEVMLTALGLPKPVIERVCFLIGHHHTVKDVRGIDWQIILEADYLVNMIEGNHSQEAIDTFCQNVFCTAEGKRLLAQVRPAE